LKSPYLCSVIKKQWHYDNSNYSSIPCVRLLGNIFQGVGIRSRNPVRWMFEFARMPLLGLRNPHDCNNHLSSNKL